jgi:molybdopterin adenylyltransferase
MNPARIAIVTISDRASVGAYEDRSGPAIEAWLKSALTSPYVSERIVVPDGVDSVADALIAICDEGRADLVLTTGGTGPAPRDLTPEAMRRVMEKELPGFGEAMRAASLREVATAILSRQTAGTRARTLIVNMPGSPNAIRTCLDAVFPAIPYCLDLIGAAFIETDPEICRAFRPKAK